MWSRYGTDFTAKFSKIAAAVRSLPAEGALIDGEAVIFLPGGHSDFAALRTKAGGARASYVAFDLPSLEGDDLRQRPLEERRALLSRLVARVAAIQFSESVARRRDRVRPRLRARGHCVEARRIPLSQRAEPELAEVPEPRVSTPVKAEKNRAPVEQPQISAKSERRRREIERRASVRNGRLEAFEDRTL